MTDWCGSLKPIFFNLVVDKTRLSNELTTELRSNVTDWTTNAGDSKHANVDNNAETARLSAKYTKLPTPNIPDYEDTSPPH